MGANRMGVFGLPCIKVCAVGPCEHFCWGAPCRIAFGCAIGGRGPVGLIWFRLSSRGGRHHHAWVNAPLQLV